MNTLLVTVMSCLLVIGHSVPVPTLAPSEDLFLENADETIAIEHGVGDEISLEGNEPVTTIQVEELVTVIMDVEDVEFGTQSASMQEPEEMQSEGDAGAVSVLEDGLLSFIHSHDEGVVEEVVTMTVTETAPEEEETEEVIDDTIHIEADVHVEGGNNGGKLKIEEIRIDLVREDVDAGSE
ncbi:uncharacterized protein LOC117124752 [Anneissia japonica]|uniref:uncharacterized protein LOC117124752 n=1 Tax=Anneissia japonica TaxID=1529436 RepID=UPI001425A77E|nr:uncharacterized protein LOC117124752 [Anneissia japonica]